LSLAVFAPRARRDLREALDWIARDNEAAARALLEAALRGARFVAARPLAGRSRPDLLPPPFRFWSLRGFPYLLVYDASQQPPPILRMLHMARDLPNALDDPDP